MNTLYNMLSSLYYFVSGIISLSVIATFLGLASTPFKPKDRLLATALMLFFAGTSYLVWWLKQQGRQGTALLVLCVLWTLIVLGILYAIGKARWN